MLLAFLVLIPLAGGAATAETLRGPFEIIDGDSLRVDGVQVDLVGIEAPPPGTRCSVAGKTIDCGRIAITALLDLTAGAKVVCHKLPGEPGRETIRARCLAGGYDLSEGMAYTGWAVAVPPETSAYARYERAARKRGRGMWRPRR